MVILVVILIVLEMGFGCIENGLVILVVILVVQGGIFLAVLEGGFSACTHTHAHTSCF